MKSTVQKSYDEIAERYQQRFEGVTAEYYQLLEEEYVFDFLNRTDRLLDIGTGTGRFVFSACERNCAQYCVGLDFSRSMVEFAKSRLKSMDVRSSRCEFVQMDSFELGFDTSTFDSVLSIGTFEYLDELRPQFREINRVLSNSGQFIFSFWNANSLFETNYGDSFERVEHGLGKVVAKLEQSGFEVRNYHGTFYQNNVVWFLDEYLEKNGIESLRQPFLRGMIGLQQLADRVKCLRCRAGELILDARKVRSL